MTFKTVRDVFGSFGIKPTNPLRPGWSNVAPDGRLVVTLWTDQFEDAERRVYNISNAPDETGWTKRLENKRRTAQLKAIGVGGLFESLVITRNPRKVNREVAFIEAGPTMRLVKLDPATGRFLAEVAHGLSDRMASPPGIEPGSRP